MGATLWWPGGRTAQFCFLFFFCLSTTSFVLGRLFGGECLLFFSFIRSGFLFRFFFFAVFHSSLEKNRVEKDFFFSQVFFFWLRLRHTQHSLLDSCALSTSPPFSFPSFFIFHMFESQIFIRLIFLFLLFFSPVFAILTYPPQPPGVLRGCLSGNMMDHHHHKTKQKTKN